jgi:hypothetical protein
MLRSWTAPGGGGGDGLTRAAAAHPSVLAAHGGPPLALVRSDCRLWAVD